MVFSPVNIKEGPMYQSRKCFDFSSPRYMDTIHNNWQKDYNNHPQFLSTNLRKINDHSKNKRLRHISLNESILFENFIKK